MAASWLWHRPDVQQKPRHGANPGGSGVVSHVLLFLPCWNWPENSSWETASAIALPYAGPVPPYALLLDLSLRRSADRPRRRRPPGGTRPDQPVALGAAATDRARHRQYRILVFLFSWNEYLIALTWLSRDDLLTLPVAMARIAG